MLNRIKQFFTPAAPSPVSSATSAVIENLEGRTLLAASFDLGININDASSATMNKAIPKLKALGVKSVRIWIGTDFKSKSWEGPMQRCVDYAKAGFDVMAAVVPKNGVVPSTANVTSWFQWAMGTALKGAVDRWQVGNEPDHDQYWRGSPVSYVTALLKPASAVLKAQGEAVVSAGPSWNPKDVQNMIDAGMLGMVDYVGYHPYATQGLYKTRLADIQKVVAGRKPLLASEWNIRGLEGNKTSWANAVKEAYPYIKGTFAINYYFALVEKSSTRAGPAGLITSSGGTTQFYNALAAAKGQTATIPSTTPATPATGNTPASAAVAPKLSAFQLLDAKTGKVLSGFSNITASTTIKLSSLSTRNILLAAVGNSGVQSVKLTAFGKTNIENEAPYNTATWAAKAGSYAVKATAYSQDKAAGTVGNTLSITLKFV